MPRNNPKGLDENGQPTREKTAAERALAKKWASQATADDNQKRNDADFLTQQRIAREERRR